jgi:hypothetical protein
MQIFGQDLFYRQETIPILRELAGFEIKPFECVATTKEILAALSLSIAKAKAAPQALPPVLQYAVEHIPGVNDAQAAAEILDSYGPHRMSTEFESILMKALYESPRSL